MNSYLERNEQLVDKETMVIIGFIYHDSEEIQYIGGFEAAYTNYTETVQEIIHDYPNYRVEECYL